MELLSGNLQIVEIGKINKKKLEDMSRLTLRCQYISIHVHCIPFDVFNTEKVFF